jgi:exodeoxyribonuclease V beta subunit
MPRTWARRAGLLYVALTRAQHHLEVWWVENHAAIGDAKLTELLTGNGRTPTGLAEASNGTVEVSTMTELAGLDPYRPQPRVPAQLEVARFDRSTDRTWRRVSFSSLSADQPLTPPTNAPSTSPAPMRPRHCRTPRPRHPGSGTSPPLWPTCPPGPDSAPWSTTCSSTSASTTTNSRRGWLELATAATARSGWDFDVAVLASGLAAAIATPLGPGETDVTLADLEASGLSRELVFELPVRTGHDPVTLAEIGAVMAEHLPGDDPYRPYVDQLLASTTLPFRGFMSGAIDLVGVLPGDRYVVMDYKTNCPPRPGPGGRARRLRAAALAAEMVSHRYVLQATLYQVALHRYLQWRLPGYDPAVNLGGSIAICSCGA